MNQHLNKVSGALHTRAPKPHAWPACMLSQQRRGAAMHARLWAIAQPGVTCPPCSESIPPSNKCHERQLVGSAPPESRSGAPEPRCTSAVPEQPLHPSGSCALLWCPASRRHPPGPPPHPPARIHCHGSTKMYINTAMGQSPIAVPQCRSRMAKSEIGCQLSGAMATSCQSDAL